MKTIENRGGDVDRRALMEAVEALREGKIIIYPTDTLYALGCNALDARAIERLCRIIGNSFFFCYFFGINQFRIHNA